MKVSTFGVVGAGQMGGGIAQVAAMNGLRVVLQDISEEFVERGLDTISKNLQRIVNKGKISENDKENILARIDLTTEMAGMADVDFVVEAASEDEMIKFAIFNELDKVCANRTVLATNTSSIPIGRIAARTSRPDKVIGMHFMNPVPVMQLVEVIRALTTSDETYETTVSLTRKMGKSPAEGR